MGYILQSNFDGLIGKKCRVEPGDRPGIDKSHSVSVKAGDEQNGVIIGYVVELNNEMFENDPVDIETMPLTVFLYILITHNNGDGNQWSEIVREDFSYVTFN